jgi:hypothetical protein
MAIPVKIRNPKTIDELQKNIEDIANSGMNKRGIDGLTGGITAVSATGTTASAGYVQAELQAVIDKVNETVAKQAAVILKQEEIINKLKGT